MNKQREREKKAQTTVSIASNLVCRLFFCKATLHINECLSTVGAHAVDLNTSLYEFQSSQQD